MAATKFSVVQLKKALANKNKEELIAEIAMLCQTFKPVKEYYQNAMGDSSGVLARYKAIIEKEFVWRKTSPPKARLSVARQAVNDFKKVAQKPEDIAEMMVYFVECVSGFISEFDGSENHYISAESMFFDALKYIEQNVLLEQFADRAKLIVEKATDSYGHYDTLFEAYTEYYRDEIST